MGALFLLWGKATWKNPHRNRSFTKTWCYDDDAYPWKGNTKCLDPISCFEKRLCKPSKDTHYRSKSLRCCFHQRSNQYISFMSHCLGKGLCIVFKNYWHFDSQLILFVPCWIKLMRTTTSPLLSKSILNFKSRHIIIGLWLNSKAKPQNMSKYSKVVPQESSLLPTIHLLEAKPLTKLKVRQVFFPKFRGIFFFWSALVALRQTETYLFSVFSSACIL